MPSYPSSIDDAPWGYIQTGCSLKIPSMFPADWTFEDYCALPGVTEHTRNNKGRALGWLSQFAKDDPALLPCRLYQRRFGGKAKKASTDDVSGTDDASVYRGGSGSGEHMWKIGRDLPDIEYGSLDNDVVGQNLYLADLPIGAATLFLALLERGAKKKDDGKGAPAITKTEELLIGALFAHLSRSQRTPPIDLDAVTESRDYLENGGGAYALQMSVDIARRFAARWTEVTGGTVVPFLTGPEKGSIHLDVALPREIRSVFCYAAGKSLKLRVTDDLSLPRAKALPSVADRPAIVIDDSIWHRGIDNRGGVWRPPLGHKRKGKVVGAAKLYIHDLDHPLNTLKPHEHFTRRPGRGHAYNVPEPVPVNPMVYQAALEEVSQDHEVTKVYDKLRLELPALFSGQWDPMTQVSPWNPTHRKVATADRKRRLAEHGIQVEIGDEDPGLPFDDVNQKALEIAKRSSLLSWIWKNMTGQDPHDPSAPRGPMVLFDRNEIEVEFATHAMLLNESWNDIIDVLRSAPSAKGRSKIAERPDLEGNYHNSVLKALERNGRGEGGIVLDKSKFAQAEIKAPVDGISDTIALIAALERGLHAADPAMTYKVRSSEGATKVLASVSALCIRKGYPFEVYLTVCDKLEVVRSVSEYAWHRTMARFEASLLAAGFNKLKATVGDDLAKSIEKEISTAVERARGRMMRAAAAVKRDQEREALKQKPRETVCEDAHEHAAAAPEQPTPPPPEPKKFKPLVNLDEQHDESADNWKWVPIPNKRKPKTTTQKSMRDIMAGKGVVMVTDYLSLETVRDLGENKKNWDRVTSWLIRSNDALKSIEFDRSVEVIQGMVRAVKWNHNSVFALSQVLGHAMALARFPRRIVERFTSETGLRGIKVAYEGIVKSFLKLKETDALPRLMADPFSLMRSGWTRGDILKLMSALSMDSIMANMPVETMSNFFPTKSWAEPERRTMEALLDRADTLGDAVHKDVKRIMKDAWRCSQAHHVSSCPDGHGVRDIKLMRCKRDIACPYCRGIQAQLISRWILDRVGWPPHLLVYRFLPTEGPVETPEYEDLPEEDDQGAFGAEDKPRRKKKGKKRVGTRVSNDMNDRLLHGIREHPEVLKLKAFCKRLKHNEHTTGSLPFRGFLGADCTYLVLPKSFTLNDSRDLECGMREVDTQEFLRGFDIFCDLEPVHYTLPEFSTFMVKTRLEVGRIFDHNLLGLSKMAHQSEDHVVRQNGGEDTPESKELFRWNIDNYGDEVLNTWTLRNRVLYVIRNEAAEKEMPWYTSESLTEMLNDMFSEQNDVPMGCCDEDVAQADGTMRKCLKKLEIVSQHCLTEHILAENSDGVIPRTEDVWAKGEAEKRFHSERVPCSEKRRRELQPLACAG